MRIQFVHIDQDSFPSPVLQAIPDGEFEIPTGTPALERSAHVKSRFLDLITRWPKCPPVLAISSTIGEPNHGSIVAAEIITDMPQQPRQLQWLYCPSSYQAETALQAK